jgi:hypothetical protein
MASLSFGLSTEQMASLANTTWNNTTNAISEEMKSFAEAMIAIGAGMWEELEDDSYKFVWATLDNLETATTEAGTKIEAWESPYDWLYNLNEKNNKLLRDKERIERRYNQALKEEGANAQELLNLSK